MWTPIIILIVNFATYMGCLCLILIIVLICCCNINDCQRNNNVEEYEEIYTPMIVDVESTDDIPVDEGSDS